MKIEISEKNSEGFWMQPYMTLNWNGQTLDSAIMEVERLIENFKSKKVDTARRIDIRKGRRIEATREYKPE